MIVFDIESCGLPESELLPFLPEFEPAKNLVDPVKIAASIEKQRAAFFEEAALSALTGKVVCVGFWTPQHEFTIFDAPQEEDVIQPVFDVLQSRLQNSEKVVGHWILGFDIPFLVQRAYRLGIHVPAALYEGRWWNSDIIDLVNIWNGPGGKHRISLDHLAKALGVGAKNGEGKDFARLWSEDRDAAFDYLENDCLLVKKCAEKMGIA